MATSRKTAPARSRSRSKGRAGRGGGRGRGGSVLPPPRLPMLPALDQRQRDVLGLALLALAVFSGFALYSSGADVGGRAGDGLATGLGWALGGARVLAPVA